MRYLVFVGSLVASMVATAGQANAVWGGGSASADGESLVPAVVHIQGSHKGVTYDCTGTMIAEQWVLTAQHCTNRGGVQGYPFAARELKVGLDKPAAKQSVQVDQVWRMGGYDSATEVNDIAVLKLSAPVGDVVPIRLADGPMSTGTNGYVYGFGETATGRRDSTRLPKVAEVARTDVASLGQQSRCRFPDLPGLTFATSVRGGTAEGDSGGPLLEWDTGDPQVFAVTAGDGDAQTCRGGSSDRAASWVGFQNRVDRQSVAGEFIVAHVPELG